MRVAQASCKIQTFQYQIRTFQYEINKFTVDGRTILGCSCPTFVNAFVKSATRTKVPSPYLPSQPGRSDLTGSTIVPDRSCHAWFHCLITHHSKKLLEITLWRVACILRISFEMANVSTVFY